MAKKNEKKSDSEYESITRDFQEAMARVKAPLADYIAALEHARTIIDEDISAAKGGLEAEAPG